MKPKVDKNVLISTMEKYTLQLDLQLLNDILQRFRNTTQLLENWISVTTFSPNGTQHNCALNSESQKFSQEGTSSLLLQTLPLQADYAPTVTTTAAPQATNIELRRKEEILHTQHMTQLKETQKHKGPEDLQTQSTTVLTQETRKTVYLQQEPANRNVAETDLNKPLHTAAVNQIVLHKQNCHQQPNQYTAATHTGAEFIRQAHKNPAADRQLNLQQVSEEQSWLHQQTVLLQAVNHIQHHSQYVGQPNEIDSQQFVEVNRRNAKTKNNHRLLKKTDTLQIGNPAEAERTHQIKTWLSQATKGSTPAFAEEDWHHSVAEKNRNAATITDDLRQQQETLPNQQAQELERNKREQQELQRKIGNSQSQLEDAFRRNRQLCAKNDNLHKNTALLQQQTATAVERGRQIDDDNKHKSILYAAALEHIPLME